MAFKLCTGCSHELLNAITRRGWKHLIRPERAEAFAKAWIAGNAKKTEIDPYVVGVFELYNHSVIYSGLNPLARGDVCPICASAPIVKRPTLALRVTWISNMLEQVMRPLLASNGLISDRVEKERARIITDYTESSINGGLPQ